MALDFTVIIPARMHSTRLPNKALADIGGKPMVVRVAERAKLSLPTKLYIATDDARIFNAVQANGFSAILTDPNHASGTERLGEAVEKLNLSDDTLIINVQGDEPFISPTLIQNLANYLQNRPHLPMATACSAINDIDDFLNPNIVKVVLDKADDALYFSRAPIPYARDAFAGQAASALPLHFPFYRHIGIYAYRAQFLRQYQSLTASPLETCEALEQLRILWHGFHIGVMKTEEHATIGVDTAEDLLKAQQLWMQENAL